VVILSTLVGHLEEIIHIFLLCFINKGIHCIVAIIYLSVIELFVSTKFFMVDGFLSLWDEFTCLEDEYLLLV
jgi:hypothetical protein